MKNFPIVLLFCFVSGLGYAQGDTLYTKKQQKIACKIFEINDYEIKYGLKDGPMYIIDRSQVTKYQLSTGFTEVITPDELSIENEHASIMKNRSVIKIHPFSLINNQLSFAYEQVIKVGMNLDIEVGYVNSGLNKQPIFGRTLNNAFYTGAYLKPGVKFFLGQDYSVKGLRYAHPLKGRYLKLDLAVSYLNYENVGRQVGGYYPTPPSTIYTDITTVALGGFVNYGRQFILGNLLTMEYFIGIGYTGQNYKYSNPNFTNNSGIYPGGYYYYNDAQNISNYHGFMRIPLVGISGTAGFRIGYIIPDKSSQRVKSTTKG